MQAFSMAFNDMQRGSGLPGKKDELEKRGINVYTASELVGITGRGKNGELITGNIEVPLFGLSIYDRVSIYQRCDSVFGVVTSRANRIAGLEWSIIKESKAEDRLEAYLKSIKQIWTEYEGQGVLGAVVRGRMVRVAKGYLPDLLSDMSNFDRALLRWHRRIQQKNEDRSTEIQDWLHEPNAEDDWEDFTKKWAQDLLVHGTDAIYKQKVQGNLENMYHLPGGSTVPLKERYVSARRMFAQAMPGMDPKIYFQDEICFSTYMPSSGIAYGMIPLEALVNKVAESLFFDQMAAERADGTRPPDKAVIFGEMNPFGGTSLTGGPDMYNVPIPREEQARLETIINEPRKNAMRVLTGVGQPVVLDLSRADTFQYQSERQKLVRESVGFVFNMSNMEMNLTGSDDTSGRSTSEAQGKIEKEKGVYPTCKTIENKVNREIIPLKFGTGYVYQYKSGLSDAEQAELDLAMIQTNTYGVNEIRIKRGDEPFGPEYDEPQNGQQAGEADGSRASPFNVQGMQ